MRFLFPLLFMAAFSFPSYAGQAEAKELARNYNCKVISIAEQGTETGAAGSTLYKVGCAVASTATEDEKKLMAPYGLSAIPLCVVW